LNRPTIGFLFLGQTHAEYSDIAACLLNQGLKSQLIDLNNSDHIQWDAYSLINVRECRGYHLDPDFLHKIEILKNKLGNTPITNSLAIIRGGIDKGKYLYALEQDGVDSIPTYWLKSGATFSLEKVIRETGWNDLVIKPTISSKCWNTYRVINHPIRIKVIRAGNQPISDHEEYGHHQACEKLLESHDVCIQQFMPEILSRGELSFVFIDGNFSHAIQKTVARQNWLAHEYFGGENRLYKTSAAEINWVQDIYARLLYKYGNFLYARIDCIPDGHKLRLLECELVVPRLFLKEGQAFEKYAFAIKKRINTMFG